MADQEAGGSDEGLDGRDTEAKAGHAKAKGGDRESKGGDAERGASTVTVTRRASDKLRAGHLWVYRSDIQTFGTRGGQRSGGTGEPDRGALVTVVDGRAIPLGTALYSAGSEIALRMVTRSAGLEREGYLEEVRRRIAEAIKLRDELTRVSGGQVSEGDDARRLIFSEGDDLPGIVVDQYGEVAVVQLLMQGTAQADVRALLREALQEVFPSGTGTIWERTDSRIREIEGLEAAADGAMWAAREARSELIFKMNGLRFHYDVRAGQKTGAFLDQRLNYAAAAEYAGGRALDVCTYQGGFALHLARRCERVTGVDASRSALEVADRNLELNRDQLSAGVDWIEADAFELMRGYGEADERFDTIVLDPPAFAKSKRAAEGALRGYKELNLRALQMLQPGGTLVTCSCSHHVSLEDFLEVLRAAAVDAGRRVQVLETRGAAPDHPAVLTLPETSYLKCVICRVG